MLIALLPKSLEASQSVERFQAAPQSLCNTVYKLLSKILATIGLSLSSQSWPNQEAIVKSRHIGEGLIIAHENDPFYGPQIIQESGCLKLDMMKALFILSHSRKREWPFLLPSVETEIEDWAFSLFYREAAGVNSNSFEW